MQRCEQVGASAADGALQLGAARPDVMRLKYAKLVLNLANAIDAICTPGPAAEQLGERAKEEGSAVLSAAAGIEFEAADVADVAGALAAMGRARHRRPGARRILDVAEPRARQRRVETDYLNGEIVAARPPARGSDPGQRAAVPARQPCSA